MKLLNFLFFFLILILSTTEEVSGRSGTEPGLDGPAGVCLTGDYTFVPYSAGGDPATDSYFWSITDETGYEIANLREPRVEIPITATGVYTIHVRVARGDDRNYFEDTAELVVERGPSFIMPPDVLLCGSEEVTLVALDDDNSHNALFAVEWLDAAGNVLGTGNTYTTNIAGRYLARVASAFCTAVGSTYVGPVLQVEVDASSTAVCMGDVVNYRPDAPVNALWSYQKEGQTTRTELGNFFELALNTGSLAGVGDYTVFFTAEDDAYPGCVVEKSFDLQVRESASFTLEKLTDAERCEVPNGSFRIQTDSPLENITINTVPETNFANVGPGESITISDLEPKTYTVTGVFNGCRVRRTISIRNENLEQGISYTVSATDQSCSDTGVSPGTITLDFGEVPQTGTYRIIRGNGQVYRGAFTNETSVSEAVPAGEYQIEIIDADDCTGVSTETYTVGGPRQVGFSIPNTIQACESYELLPESDQDLRYVITGPNGETTSLEAGEANEITESGSYGVLAIATDPDSPLCPRNRTVAVTISEQIEFDYTWRQIDCLGNQTFLADLQGRDPNSVTVRWLTEDNVIVGREMEFFPPTFGTFYLDVQPRASAHCPAAPISFTVGPVERSVDVAVEGGRFCGLEPFTTLSVITDLELVKGIEWYYLDEEGNRLYLEHFDNLESIDVADEGSYEVVVRNHINCVLGREQFDAVRIEDGELGLEETFYICGNRDITTQIKPGEFESYGWYLEGEELSTAPRFVPEMPGLYELRVVDSNGCEASSEFVVEEICDSLVVTPTAMIPGDEAKDFRLFASPAIAEVEVFIISRLGELVFYCQTSNPQDGSPQCIWQGDHNGQPVSPGTYAVIVKYENASMGLVEEISDYILVLE